MPRALPEWIGETDDTPVPPKVKARVLKRSGNKCQKCTRTIGGGVRWDTDHIIPIIQDGPNRESNLQALCTWCHGEKTRCEVQQKAREAKRAKSHAGIKRQTRPLPGSRASGLRKRMDGTVERW